MGAVSAVSGGLGVIGGVKQLIEGEQDKSAAAAAIRNLKRPQATNAYENTQVSTLGADLAREEQARLAATQVGALQDMGARASVGGIGRVVAGNQDNMNRIAANLDEQQQRINMAKAEDEKRIQQQAQDYYQQDLSNLSSQYNAARDSSAQGFSNTLMGLNNVGNALKKDTPKAGVVIGGNSSPESGITTSESGTPLDLTNPDYMYAVDERQLQPIKTYSAPTTYDLQRNAQQVTNNFQNQIGSMPYKWNYNRVL